MKKPNIILISIDTLRADHLSCYGYQRETTPNIDKLASEGTIYRRNYSTGVWTPPGHASMLTGLYVSEHGVYGENRLSSSIPTIAEKLKAHGYQTAGFVNNSQVGELVGFEKGHDTFVEVWKGVKPGSFAERMLKGAVRRIRDKAGYEDMGAARTNRLFKNWLGNQIDKEKPFYAFLQYIEPHNPLNPPRPFKGRFSNRFSRNVDLMKVSKVAHNPLICFVEDIQPNTEEIDTLKALYDGEIAYIDHRIGELVSTLKGNNFFDDTLIIITSDHGEHFGEHGLWSHTASLYNEVLHIPLIMKFPKGTNHVTEENNLTQLVDIFPTVMEVAGISSTERTKTSGASLLGSGKSSAGYHDYLFAEWEGRVPYFIQSRLSKNNTSRTVDRIKNKKLMIFDGEYKYISTSDGQEELYHVHYDRKEQKNLIDQKKDIASALKSRLTDRISEMNSEDVEERNAVDEETIINLKSLGYM